MPRRNRLHPLLLNLIRIARETSRWEDLPEAVVFQFAFWRAQIVIMTDFVRVVWDFSDWRSAPARHRRAMPPCADGPSATALGRVQPCLSSVAHLDHHLSDRAGVFAVGVLPFWGHGNTVIRYRLRSTRLQRGAAMQPMMLTPRMDDLVDQRCYGWNAASPPMKAI
jgi:hypothetical protein